MPSDIESYNNPMQIQENILKDLENKFGGAKTIVDPNNAFCFLLEAFSEVVSDSISAIEDKFSSYYAKRAIDSYDLYNHMSDEDYVGIFSLPASTQIEMILDKQYLIDNAIEYSYIDESSGLLTTTNYKLVQIPADTIFTIGNNIFKLYYPIDIRINKITNSFVVIYNTDKNNPLHSLQSNNVIKKEYTFNGLDLLSISFPVYQFEKSSIEEIMHPEFGFKKQYEYTNKFYAIRVFNYINDTYEEINYTLSNIVYDPDKPTVKLKVFPETNIIEVSIPQIYFTNGDIGTKIKIDILTTNGALNIGIDNVNIENIYANFNLSSKDANLKYSNILKNIPFIQIIPLDSEIVGGSDGYDFTELKNRVIYGSHDNVVPITKKDIEFFFKDNGFIFHKGVDNLTDRVYFALKKIEDEASAYLSINTKFKINKQMIDNAVVNEYLDDYSSILRYPESITILSNTVFKYDKVNNQAIILNDEDAAKVEPLSTDFQIDKVNDEIYLKSPYYLSLITKDEYPSVSSYDIYSCSAKNIKFIHENPTMSMQANVIGSSITHYINKIPNPNIAGKKLSSGGYRLYLEVLKSNDLKELEDYQSENSDDPTFNLIVHLSMKSSTGYSVGLDGVLDSDLSTDDSSIYVFDLESNFEFFEDQIALSNLMTTEVVSVHFMSLITECVVSFHIKKSLINSPDIKPDSLIDSYLTSTVDSRNGDYTPTNYIGISAQSITIEFGKWLKDSIYNNLTVTYSPYQKEIWETDELLTYTKDEYERDSNGALVYTVNGDVVSLNKIHSAGDTVFDSSGASVYKHRAGDVKVDACGNELIAKPRAIEYTIETFLFDIRHFHGNTLFNKVISSLLNSYYTSVKNIQNNVLENTNTYFKPIDLIGNNTFTTANNETITLPLGLLFRLTCYVTTKTFNDANLRAVINDKIISIINEHLSKTLISFIDIAEQIKSDLGDLIVTIDINGIDGNESLQTLVNTSTDKLPSVKKVLTLLGDNTLQFDDIIDITFKKLD